MSCGEWGLTLAAILVVFVLTAMFVLASVGVAPVVDSNGLSWDATGYISHEANRTARFVTEQHEQTERNRQDNETTRTVVVVGALAGVLVVGIVQHNRTRRHRAQVDTMVRLYVAQTYPHAQVEQRNGAKVLVDYARCEIVPYGVIVQEASGEVDGNWRRI